MKKLWPGVLIVFLMPAIISSCKKDRNDEPQIVAEMWYFDKVVSEQFDSTGTVVNSETDSAWTADDYLALASDGRFEILQDGDRLVGLYTIENSVLSLTYNQINNANQTVSVTTTASVVEKTPSKFTFYVEQILTTGKGRVTLYLSK